MKGKLIAIGNSNSIIRFTADDPSKGWKGINFDATGNSYHSDLIYCTIEYVTKPNPGVNTCPPGLNWDGAIYINNFTNINIENCIIKNNIIFKRGGGIFVCTSSNTSGVSGQVQILNNQIYDNKAKRGGGICIFSSGNHNYNANAYISGNTIYNNESSFSGGGIAVFQYAYADIIANKIHDNISKCTNTKVSPNVNGGGGIVIGLYSHAEIINNSVYNNATLFNSNTNALTGIGGGILVRIAATASILNNEIYNNTADNSGGGIAILNGNGTNGSGASYAAISSNFIFDNTANYNGGGVFISHSNARIDDSFISNNMSGNGGGICINNLYSQVMGTSYIPPMTMTTITKNHINNNIADIGAGIWAQGASSTAGIVTTIEIINNLIYSNQTVGFAAAILLEENMVLTLNNNTISNNLTPTNAIIGDGLYIHALTNSNQLSAVNNIIYYNGADHSLCQIVDVNVQAGEFKNNDIQNLGCQIPTGTNYDLPPDFVDQNINNYRLLPSSPIINMGLNSVIPIPSTDMDGVQRFNGIIDIGAYEYSSSGARKGTLDTNKIALITVFPNPSPDIINIVSETNITQVEIFDKTGKLVFNNLFNSSNFSINISSFSNGLYLLRFMTNSKYQYYKIIKE